MRRLVLAPVVLWLATLASAEGPPLQFPLGEMVEGRPPMSEGLFLVSG